MSVGSRKESLAVSRSNYYLYACRSIDYVATIGECSLSHDTKEDAIESFVRDSEVDYYEWRCVQLASKFSLLILSLPARTVNNIPRARLMTAPP